MTPRDKLPTDPLPPLARDGRGGGGGSRDLRLFLTVVGCVLIVLWFWFWFQSVAHGYLIFARWIRLPAWPHLGLDYLHNYAGVRVWFEGGNPYRDDIGDVRGSYAYPPVVLLLFVWSRLFDWYPAIVVWMGVIAAITVAATWLANRTRRELGLTPLPSALAIALMLCSEPILFAMERGQADALALLAIVIAAVALRRPQSWGRDILIGGCLAVATWVKIYPGFVMLGLLALGARRAFVLAVIEAALIGIIPYRATLDSLQASAQQDRVNFVTEVASWLSDPNYSPAQLAVYAPVAVEAHSLTTYWPMFWGRVGIDSLARMPGVVGAALILFPPALWLSLQVLRSPRRLAVRYPYMLWMASMGSFWMPISFDYNLFYLALAALAVCARGDNWAVMLGLLATVVWWQPVELPPYFSSEIVFGVKMISLMGIGIGVAMRAREPDRLATRAPKTPEGAMLVGASAAT